MIEFANLTNGVACAPPDARVSRIQSTWCEQKLWEDVLWTVPAELYYHAGQGRLVVVHDQSERVRATRAQWQGLSLVRHVCRRAWGLPRLPEPARRDGGTNMSPYWDGVYEGLSERVKRYVRYFEGAASQVLVEACTCERARFVA